MPNNTASRPTGIVTFLFTDIEGSTRLWENHPDPMRVAHARHNEILRSAIESNDGYVFQVIGDSFCAAFQQAENAVRASTAAQVGLNKETWGECVIKVRMGIHTGNAEIQENGDYQGYLSLSRVQRLMSAGHGGQALISLAAHELLDGKLPEGVSLLDMGEKRLKDLTQPEHIYQLVIPSLPANFPPLKTLDIYRHNLPAQVTTFIGREKQIEEIKSLVANHRAVTLTGSGGAGKTRLSLQVGAESLDQFANGVWFVELAALTDASLVTGAIMAAMGLREKDSDLHALANTIGNQSVLLILDNCEHLIEECARLAEGLIKLCPKLHVLASSREAFGIAGERPFRVPSLAFPDPKKSSSMDEIAKCESVQLFIERVKTYVPTFSLTEKNASSVAQICSRLDGIPLALELAAARVKVMSVEQMAARLGDVFGLLTSGSRTALPRQQTLRALIEWSYDLLSEAEKTVFRRLAAFSGGWSLEAAESVCSQERIESVEVMDILARLVDKSLVNKEDINGEARFHMLETIRQYAQFKLFASEEVEDVKDRHRDWFMQLAETAEPILRTGGQLPWLEWLEMEHDNLRAAMRWCVEQKQVEQALRIPSALAYFWDIHGHAEEGRNWFNQALAVDGAAKAKHPFAWAKAIDGHFYLFTSLSRAVMHFQADMEEALKIFREHGDDFQVAHTLYHLAYIPHFAGDMKQAKSAYEQSLDMYRRINDAWGIGGCLHCIAHVAEQQGSAEASRNLFDESLSYLKTSGDRWSLYHPVGDSGRLLLNEGKLKEAREIYEESIQTFEELGNRSWVSSSLRQLAKICQLQGDFEKARQYAEEGVAISKAINDLIELPWNQLRIGLLQWSLEEFAQAHQSILSGMAVSEKMLTERDAAYLKCMAGFMECHAGHPLQGIEKMKLELDGALKDTPIDVYDLLPWFAHTLWLERDIPRAKQTYRDALKGVHKMKWLIRIPECLEGLGKVAVTENDLERAARLFGSADAMREKMGTPIPPVLREDYDEHKQMTREKLGKDFEGAWSTGRGMTVEETVPYALGG